ncbi:Melanopsin [Cichlidogyrus casuarinus]|uniref:Melanopsin n=1 Tax=Cichlidogyrus casuarinus TaxID=1844966 RepID=A0ABD2Q2S8_9PLAT
MKVLKQKREQNEERRLRSVLVLRTASNILLLNLATSDLLFSMLVGFPLKTIASFNGTWPWGKRLCDVYGFLCGISGISAFITHAFISLERYRGVCTSMRIYQDSSYGKYALKIAFIWTWSGFWTSLPFFGIGKYMAEGFLTSCTYDYLDDSLGSYIFNYGMLIFAFLIPLLVMIFCYSAIVRHVVINYARLNFSEPSTLERISGTLQSTRPAMENLRYRRKLRIAIISFVIVLSFLISWCPYVIVAFFALIGRRQFLTPFAAELPVFFAKSSSVYNPIIYALLHTRFKTELVRKFSLLNSVLRSTSTRSTSVRSVSRVS